MKPKTEILIKYSDLVGKYPLKKIFKYLNGKVLKESVITEAKYDKKDATNFLFRRLSKNQLEDEFYENYEYCLENYIKYYGISYSEFKRRFITYMIDAIHGFLIDGFIESSDMHEAVTDLLEEMYEDGIEELWFKITEDEH